MQRAPGWSEYGNVLVSKRLRVQGEVREIDLNAHVTRRYKTRGLTFNVRLREVVGTLQIPRVFSEYGFLDQTGTTAELAKQQHGMYQPARALRLDYAGLKGANGDRGQSRQKRTTAGPSFIEFIAPWAKPVTDYAIEVELARGSKLRLNLHAIATT